MPRRWFSRATRSKHPSLARVYDMYCPSSNTGTRDHDNLCCPICHQSFPRDRKSAAVQCICIISLLILGYRPLFLSRLPSKLVTQDSRIQNHLQLLAAKEKKRVLKRLRTASEYSFIASKHEYCISILNRGSKPQRVMLWI